MISEDTVITDDLDDDVSVILQAMSDDDTWTSNKSALREELVSLLKKRRYVWFIGSPYKYYAHRVGDSYLYDVPLYKQALLDVTSSRSPVFFTFLPDRTLYPLVLSPSSYQIVQKVQSL